MIIYYYDFEGNMNVWVCQNMEEYDYAMNVLNEEDIFDIR